MPRSLSRRARSASLFLPGWMSPGLLGRTASSAHSAHESVRGSRPKYRHDAASKPTTFPPNGACEANRRRIPGLRHRHLQAQRENRLHELLADRARPARPGKPDHLHGDGAPAAHHLARARCSRRSARAMAARVHAGVTKEPLVLPRGQQRRHEPFGDLPVAGKPPLAVRRDRRASRRPSRSSSIVEYSGDEEASGQGEPEQRRGSQREGRRAAKAAGGRPGSPIASPAASEPLAGTTARIVESYIASTVTAGR